MIHTYPHTRHRHTHTVVSDKQTDRKQNSDTLRDRVSRTVAACRSAGTTVILWQITKAQRWVWSTQPLSGTGLCSGRPSVRLSPEHRAEVSTCLTRPLRGGRSLNDAGAHRFVPSPRKERLEKSGGLRRVWGSETRRDSEGKSRGSSGFAPLQPHRLNIWWGGGGEELRCEEEENHGCISSGSVWYASQACSRLWGSGHYRSPHCPPGAEVNAETALRGDTQSGTKAFIHEWKPRTDTLMWERETEREGWR